MSRTLSLIALQDFPLVDPGDDVAQLVGDSLATNELQLLPGDVVVVAQKIVSKAEDQYVSLIDVEASAEAEELALQVDKDPRLVELILQESKKVLRHKPGVLIVEHRLGFVHANAGIDQSNLPDWENDQKVLLLPKNPDGSAAQILAVLRRHCDGPIAVIISDSAGRAWRVGTIGMAIGTAGMDPLRSHVGDPDLYGRRLNVTEIAVADELASAACVLMGEAAEACPVIIVRGAVWSESDQGSAALIRSRDADLFR
jgi:coenzyme F420-0:L-glutamate ligase/coenzyme F420-1:gamma-L-glutamate ligase